MLPQQFSPELHPDWDVVQRRDWRRTCGPRATDCSVNFKGRKLDDQWPESGRRMAAATRTPGTPMRASRNRRLARGRLAPPLRPGPCSARVGTPLTSGLVAPLPVEASTSRALTSSIRRGRLAAALALAPTGPIKANGAPRARLLMPATVFTYIRAKVGRKVRPIVAVSVHG